MIGVTHYLQVFQPVVLFIPIDVVNKIGSFQTGVNLFHQIPVFHLVFSIDGYIFVTRSAHHINIGREDIYSNTVIHYDITR